VHLHYPSGALSSLLRIKDYGQDVNLLVMIALPRSLKVTAERKRSGKASNGQHCAPFIDVSPG
jgi:hypothetical protein